MRKTQHYKIEIEKFTFQTNSNEGKTVEKMEHNTKSEKRKQQ